MPITIFVGKVWTSAKWADPCISESFNQTVMLC